MSATAGARDDDGFVDTGDSWSVAAIAISSSPAANGVINVGRPKDIPRRSKR